MTDDLSSAEYRCPGEAHSISRSVHLGRLSGFYPACRDCRHRDDTAGLSARRIRQLTEVHERERRPELFHAEGVGNVPITALSPETARRIAVEFAQRAVDLKSRAAGRPATVMVGHDGRLATAEIYAAIVEGVRWTGCGVVDIGQASAPCAARCIERQRADGGIYLGNPVGAPHAIGLKFWAGGEPLSQGPLLDAMSAALAARPDAVLIDRPARAFGLLSRHVAAESYLNDLRPAYHALRPLRFVLDCPIAPIKAYLDELLATVACRMLPAAITSESLGEQVVATEAHLGIAINDDGENCRVVDERGQPIATDRLLALLAEGLGLKSARGETLRQATFQRMQARRAALAADPAGRIWYALDHAPTADALQTLTLLLVLLSRDDRPFSAVLDRPSPAV